MSDTPALAKTRSAAAVREQKAMDLRLAGLTLSQIAQQLGYANASSAKRAIDRHLAENYPPENVTTLRAREVARLERIRQALWPRVLRGESDAVNSAIRLSERLAKLQGLDAPMKVEVSTEMDEQIKNLAAALEVSPPDDDGTYVITDAP